MFACSAYNKTKLLYDWSHLVWSACKSVISHLDYWRSFLHLKKRNSLKTPINFVRMVKLYINSCCTCIFTLGSILQSHVASSWTWSCWFLYFRIMLTQTTRMDQYRVLGAEDGSCEAHTVMCVDCVALFLCVLGMWGAGPSEVSLFPEQKGKRLYYRNHDNVIGK